LREEKNEKKRRSPTHMRKKKRKIRGMGHVEHAQPEKLKKGKREGKEEGKNK